jgi:hypothetical protein
MEPRRFETVEVTKPQMFPRVVASALVLIVGVGAYVAISAWQTTVGADLAVGQVNGGDKEYALVQAFTAVQWLSLVSTLTVLALAGVWAEYGWRRYKYVAAPHEEDV